MTMNLLKQQMDVKTWQTHIENKSKSNNFKFFLSGERQKEEEEEEEKKKKRMNGRRKKSKYLLLILQVRLNEQ